MLDVFYFSLLSCRISTEKTVKFNKKTPLCKLPAGALYKPPCVQLIQPDTKEYLNHRGTKIGVSREPKRGDKGGGKEGKRGRRGDRA